MENKILKTILFFALLFSVGILCYSNIFHYTAVMDSDIASDAVLAREIAENGMKIPDTWITSTETRLFYPLNFAALFYSIFPNLNLSMGIACSFCALLVIASMVLLYKSLEYKTVPILIAVLIPFAMTDNYHDVLEMYVLFAGYYFSVIFLDFILLYFYSVFIKDKLKAPFVIVSVIVALLAGMQGMRGLLMVFIPLITTEMIRCIITIIKKRKIGRLSEYKILIWTITIGVISYLYAKVFAEGATETGRNIRHAPEKFVSETLPSVIDFFISGESVLLPALLLILAICSFGYVVYRMVKVKSERDARFWCNLQLWISFFGMVFAMTLTTTEASVRYSVFVIFAIASTIGLMLTEIDFTGFGKAVLAGVVITVLLGASVSAIRNSNQLIIGDVSMESDRADVTRYLQSKDIKKGYTTFDFASVFTVISNDKERICPIDSFAQMNGCKWLSNSNWYPPYSVEDGEVAVITTDATDEDFEMFLRENPKFHVNEKKIIGEFFCYIVDKDPGIWIEK